MGKAALSTKVKIAILVGVVALVSVIVAALVYNQPERKVNRLLDLGQKYLEEENFEQAVVTYKFVLEIEPKNEKATSGAVTAYLGWSDQLVAEEDYEKAKEILTEGYELTGDQQLQDALQEVDQLAQLGEYKAELDDVLSQVISLCDAGSYDEATVTWFESDLKQKLDEMTLDKYIYHDSNGKTAGVYEGGYVYYGDYDGEIRSGQGVWICYEHYYFMGAWSNDKPNGAQEMHGTGTTMVVYTWSGNMVDGLWDGEVVAEYSDSNLTWHFEYNMGKVRVLDIRSENENTYYIVAQEGFHRLSYSEESVNATHGVIPFAEEN